MQTWNTITKTTTTVRRARAKNSRKFHFIRSEIRITFPVNIFCHTLLQKWSDNAAVAVRPLCPAYTHTHTHTLSHTHTERATNWSDSIGWDISNYATSTPVTNTSRAPLALPRPPSLPLGSPFLGKAKRATTNENSKNIRIRSEFWLLRLPVAVYLASPVIYGLQIFCLPIWFLYNSFLFCFLLSVHCLAGCQKGNMCCENCTFL